MRHRQSVKTTLQKQSYNKRMDFITNQISRKQNIIQQLTTIQPRKSIPTLLFIAKFNYKKYSTTNLENFIHKDEEPINFTLIKNIAELD